MKKYDFDKVIDRRGTAAIKYDMLNMLFGEGDILPMWVADMDFEVPDFIVEAIQERVSHPIYGYTRRTDAFYEAVAGWLERRHGWNVNTESIDFSPGVVPALVMAVLAYTDPGDRVLVQPPVYFPFFSSINNHNREQVNNQLIEKDGEYTIDFDHLEFEFRKGVKMMLFCHPHNPVGRAWTREELTKLAELAVEYKVLVVSDEIHSDLLLFGHKHIPFASINREVAKQTITCVAPSKTFNLAGLHTSALIIEDSSLRKKYKEILDHIHIGGGNLFGFTALEAAYTKGDDWLDQLIKYLEGNYLLLKNELAERAPGVRLSPLEATYLSWANFGYLGLTDEKLMELFVSQAKLACIDGPRFGAGGSQYMRLNIAMPRKLLRKAMDQLTHALRSC